MLTGKLHLSNLIKGQSKRKQTISKKRKELEKFTHLQTTEKNTSNTLGRISQAEHNSRARAAW